MLDANFWTAVIAFFALLVSLLPYIKKIVRKAKLEVDIYDSILVTHYIGNPIVQINLIIKNIGGNSISIKDTYIDVYRDNEKIVKLPLKNYLDKFNDSIYLPFKKITLEPNEEWHHGARFLNFFSREDSSKYKESERSLKNEIERIRKESEPNDVIQADKSFIVSFEELFDKHFIWKEGNYLLKLFIKTDNEKVDIIKNIKFTLFESVKQEFENDKNRYLSGDRIYWYSDNYNVEWIDIEITD
jgi:hypothetical protein